MCYLQMDSQFSSEMLEQLQQNKHQEVSNPLPWTLLFLKERANLLWDILGTVFIWSGISYTYFICISEYKDL